MNLGMYCVKPKRLLIPASLFSINYLHVDIQFIDKNPATVVKIPCFFCK